ncbi:MAG: glycosyltransferase [Acidobacteriota bacterium]
MEISVVVPVFNGENYVAESLTGLLHFLGQQSRSFEIVVVDDGSTDRTASVLQGITDSRVRTIALERNSGKYSALKAGMAATTGTCRVFTDADVPYDLEAIPFVAQLIIERGIHIVVGDRSLAESSFQAPISPLRHIATDVFSFFVTLLVTGGLFDTQCGLKGLRGDVADALFPLVRDDGFSGDVELLYIALKHNLEIKRIPVRLQRSAPSTVRLGRHALRMIMRIASLRWYWKHGRYSSAALERIASQAYWEPPR